MILIPGTYFHYSILYILALETIGTSSRAEWVQEWPVQSVLVAAFITATAQCQEAIKGGTSALKDLELKYKKFNEEIVEVSDDSIDNATQEVLSSMMIHDIYTRETIDCLIKDQVVSEKDYAWRSRPKCYYGNYLYCLCLHMTISMLHCLILFQLRVTFSLKCWSLEFPIAMNI